MIIGIVGKPNVGKSAFFRSLTLADVESGDFPFTTIDANSAIGYVKTPDPAVLFNNHSTPRDGFVQGDWRFVPIEIIDVAGLVPGASEGKGLGNKFLDDLRQAHALIHVIDLSGSTNGHGEKVEINSYDPANDIRFLEEELNQWFFNVISKHWKNIEKKMRLKDEKIEQAIGSIISGLNINEKQIRGAVDALDLTKDTVFDNLFELCKKLREISKPMIIAANKCDILMEDNLFQKKIDKLQAEFPLYKILPVAANYEFNLKKANDAGFINYVNGEDEFTIVDESKLSEPQKAGLTKMAADVKAIGGTGVQQALDFAVFNLLEMKPIYPGGLKKIEGKTENVIVDCFLMDKNATALDFAYRLHTDFGKYFIKATDVKTKMMVGKDHVLKFGDVIEITSGK
jgi:ribosome-binding ATPase YchF (GTP1/OBG family)